MAFTDTQKDQIRRYLGYPAAHRDQNYQLESMMDTVGANDVEKDTVIALLDEIAALDVILGSGLTAQSMGALKKVDEIEFYPAKGNTEIDSMSAFSRAKILIERLRQRFGVPLAGYYFGTRVLGFEMVQG